MQSEGDITMKKEIYFSLVFIVVIFLTSCDGNAPSAATDLLYECVPSKTIDGSYYNTVVCQACDNDPLARAPVGGPSSQNTHASTNTVAFGRCGNSVTEGDFGKCSLRLLCLQEIPITSGAEGTCVSPEDVCCSLGQVGYIYGDLCGFDSRGPNAPEQTCVPTGQCAGTVVPVPNAIGGFRRCMNGAECCQTGGAPQTTTTMPGNGGSFTNTVLGYNGGATCDSKSSPCTDTQITNGECSASICTMQAGDLINIGESQTAGGVTFQKILSSQSGNCVNYWLSAKCIQ